jgi:hypothetical protein
MNWEAVAAISTAFTGLVIAVTAFAAFRELRLSAEHAAASRDHLRHLQLATQFEGVRAVFDELDSPQQMEARRFVTTQLAIRMRDPTFRAEVARVGGVDETVHLELQVLRCFERLAYYVRKGFVDPDVFYNVASGRVFLMWALLEEVVAIQRETLGQPWKNFEQLERDVRVWCEQHEISGAVAFGIADEIRDEYRRLRYGPDPIDAVEAPVVLDEPPVRSAP